MSPYESSESSAEAINGRESLTQSENANHKNVGPVRNRQTM